jgi:uncharacterized protein (DUF58 family)
MFTRHAALLGFVAFCFYLIAVVNSLPSFYYALTWLAVGMLGASLGIALLSLIGLECKFQVSRSRAAASLHQETGEGPLVAVSLANSGTLNKTGIVLEFRLRDAQDELQNCRFLLEAIPSGSAIEANLPLSKLRRGKYRLEEVRLKGSDVLGLFHAQKRLVPEEEVARDVIVGPAIVRAEDWERMGGGGARSGSQKVVRSGHGEELRGTRPYAPGDDLRHVHWKSSARAGELVVKEFEQTGRETALVLWDGAAETTWGVGDWISTEWGLILCASICRALLGGATPCDFARLDTSPLVVESRSLSNGEIPLNLIDALAAARADRTSSLESATSELPRLTSRSYSTVVLVTASLSPGVAQAARFWSGRGARVQVVLVDSASLATQSGDRRFRARGARFPSQLVETSQVPITSTNYEAQIVSLREAGFEVVHAVATNNLIEADLARALHELFTSSRLRHFANARTPAEAF